nr:hypothetical protein Iba_chr02cCG10700 [Ipomoea batatas]
MPSGKRDGGPLSRLLDVAAFGNRHRLALPWTSTTERMEGWKTEVYGCCSLLLRAVEVGGQREERMKSWVSLLVRCRLMTPPLMVEEDDTNPPSCAVASLRREVHRHVLRRASPQAKRRRNREGKPMLCSAISVDQEGFFMPNASAARRGREATIATTHDSAVDERGQGGSRRRLTAAALSTPVAGRRVPTASARCLHHQEEEVVVAAAAAGTEMTHGRGSAVNARR